MSLFRILYGNIRIFGIFAKHLFAPNGNSRWERIRGACEELGVVFVKIGQMLSLRYEFVSQDGRKILERLLDRTPELPLETVRSIVEREVGPIAEVFAQFYDIPVGSASIAQVHRARLKTGEEVAVKVRRPGIVEEFERTVKTITPTACALDWVPFLRRFRPSWLLAEVVEYISHEIDFATEVENIELLRREYAKSNANSSYTIAVPQAHRTLCGENVIVMDWIDGTPINRCSRQQAEGARDILRHFFCTIVEPVIAGKSHKFHMDPHPANLLYLDEHTLGLVDCGLVGQLAPEDSLRISRAILGIYTGNVDVVTNAMFALADHATPKQRALARQDFVKYVQNARERPMGAWCLEMLNILTRHGIRFPAAISLLGRSIIIMDGVIEKFGAGTNVEDILGNLLKKYIVVHTITNAPAILGAAYHKAQDKMLHNVVGLLDLAWQNAD